MDHSAYCKGAFTTKAKLFFRATKSHEKSTIFFRAARLGRLGRLDVGNAFTAAHFQRRVFSGAIFTPSLNISTLRRSSRNSGQSALEAEVFQ